MRNNLLEKRMIQLSCHMESHTLSWEEEFDWWKVNPGVRALECVEERPRSTGIKTETPGGRIIIVSRFGIAVRRYAVKRKDLGSIPLRLTFLFKKVVVCGHCPVTLSITSY